MNSIHTLQDLKRELQNGFDNNEFSLESFGKTYSTQLKANLIESTNKILEPIDCPDGQWSKLDDSIEWYTNQGGKSPNTFFLDKTRDRVWVLYSILEAQELDNQIKNWLEKTKGLDRCWLSRAHLLHWEDSESWYQRGLGIRFSDGLSPEEENSNFSLKAWYGAERKIIGLQEIIDKAKSDFAIYSARWQERREDSVTISVELYSNGKITINRATDVDNVFISVSGIANQYEDDLKKADDLRSSSMGAFEIHFGQGIDLEAFSNTVRAGKGDMQLWLVETEENADFKRFKGVDMHTWDRVFMDIGPNFAYLTIPGKGCVNAVPRIATIQGEDNAGKTSIFFDGEELFA